MPHSLVCPEGGCETCGAPGFWPHRRDSTRLQAPSPCGSTRPLARLPAARLKMREALLPRGTARSVWAYRDFGHSNCAPIAPSLSHDPARSIWACRDFGLSKSAPPAPRPLAGGRAQTQNLASSSILKASCLGASSGALAATRASSLKNSGREEQSPPTRAAAPATSGLTGGRAPRLKLAKK